jgi:hypothetical protein
MRRTFSKKKTERNHAAQTVGQRRKGNPRLKTFDGLLLSADESQGFCRDRTGLCILCGIHRGRSPLNGHAQMPAHFLPRDFQNIAKTVRASHNISNFGRNSVGIHPSRSCAGKVEHFACFPVEGRAGLRLAKPLRHNAFRNHFKTLVGRVYGHVVERHGDIALDHRKSGGGNFSFHWPKSTAYKRGRKDGAKALGVR